MPRSNFRFYSPAIAETEKTAGLLAGVIEGFYGQPWLQRERFQLFEWMQAWGLNTYLYAPKDDLKHRAIWRECYSESELAVFREIVERCRERGVRFVYGIGPGLDIRFSSAADLAALTARVEQMFGIGCGSFAVLFDDIPDRMREEDARRFGSFATAQAHVANEIYGWMETRLAEPLLLFCPTPYCGRMAERALGGEGYLETVGRELRPGIEVFWTGPEIISEKITAEHARGVAKLLGRKPVIWDNLHANDYDGRRFYCGPYAGREPGMRAEVRGVLSNPNNEFALNYVPLKTLARYASSTDGDPRAEYLEALAEWHSSFTTVRAAILFEQLRAFADCYYLPFEDGEEARRLLEALKSDPAEARQRIAVLKDFCVRVTELKDRALFYALARRVWDLREELDLLERYLDWRAAGAEGAFRSDFHLPGTYRGGFVPKLHALLEPLPDGSFVPQL